MYQCKSAADPLRSPSILLAKGRQRDNTLYGEDFGYIGGITERLGVK